MLTSLNTSLNKMHFKNDLSEKNGKNMLSYETARDLCLHALFSMKKS